MRIFKVDIKGSAIHKAKSYPPIGVRLNGPNTLAITLHQMQLERWLIHILDNSRRIERGQDKPKTVSVIGADLAAVVFLEQKFQALMPKVLYHLIHSRKMSIDICQAGSGWPGGRGVVSAK